MEEVNVKRLVEAIMTLKEEGDPDSLKILSIIDRLMADDWHGTKVSLEFPEGGMELYEVFDKVLKAAEEAAIG